MYAPDGTEQRVFEMNKDLPEGVKKLDAYPTVQLVTADYVIFERYDDLRIFSKKDGKYVGDITITVQGATAKRDRHIFTADTNSIYLVDNDTRKLYRLDL